MCLVLACPPACLPACSPASAPLVTAASALLVTSIEAGRRQPKSHTARSQSFNPSPRNCGSRSERPGCQSAHLIGWKISSALTVAAARGKGR
ncbi:hypothetical protein E2C01_077502 [Portunus trituberculatus]|uniref:Uncharacterized protein n=1 Tax=Portunus trituberculatus TaxID=210409 RepID=A0A5B7IMA3_PORTR|nr:hypothetical protein [Portunus trituberculatus]